MHFYDPAFLLENFQKALPADIKINLNVFYEHISANIKAKCFLLSIETKGLFSTGKKFLQRVVLQKIIHTPDV